MQFETHWKSWGGAAGGALVADYAQNKMKPLVATQANGRLAAIGMLAVQVLGWGNRYRPYVDGAADWAVGDLARSLLASRLGLATSAATTVLTPKSTTAASTHHTASTTGANGLAGVPSSAASAAFNNPITGY